MHTKNKAIPPIVYHRYLTMGIACDIIKIIADTVLVKKDWLWLGTTAGYGVAYAKIRIGVWISDSSPPLTPEPGTQQKRALFARVS